MVRVRNNSGNFVFPVMSHAGDGKAQLKCGLVSGTTERRIYTAAYLGSKPSGFNDFRVIDLEFVIIPSNQGEGNVTSVHLQSDGVYYDVQAIDALNLSDAMFSAETGFLVGLPYLNE